MSLFCVFAIIINIEFNQYMAMNSEILVFTRCFREPKTTALGSVADVKIEGNG